MADSEIMTPGSAVADTLQQILATKRANDRQSMIDQLNARDTDAKINYMNENSKSLAANRQAQAAERTEIGNQKWLGTLGDSPTQLDPATAAKLQAIAPNRLQTSGGATLPSTPTIGGASLPGTPGSLQDSGTPSPSISPALSTQASPSQPDSSVPMNYQYTGSPLYQKQHAVSQQLSSLEDDPEFNSMDPMHQFLKVSSMFPGQDPASALERILTAKSQQATGHQYVVTPEGKRLDLGTVGPNDKIEMLPREPKEPAATVSMIGTDPNTGLPVTMSNRVDVNGQSVIMSGGKPYTGPIGPKINKSGTPFTAKEIKDYATLQGAVTPKPGPMGLWINKPTDQAVKAHATTRTALIDKYGKTANVKQFASALLPEMQNDPYAARHSPEEIIQHQLETHPGISFTPDEMNNLIELVGTLR